MAYPDVILAETSLQSYWHLDEPSGNAADSKGAITGTYGGGVGRSRAGLVPSYVNDACETFSADGGGVTFGDNYDFSGTAAMSAEIWVKVQSYANADEHYLMAKFDPATTTGWSVNASSSGVFFRRNEAGGGGGIDYFTAFTAGNTYHVVGTYDGTTMQLYLNGSAVSGGAANSQSLTNHAVALAMGAAAAGGSAGNWVLDEFAIYNAALSQSQVSAHYLAGVSVGGPGDNPPIGILGRGAGW